MEYIAGESAREFSNECWEEEQYNTIMHLVSMANNLIKRSDTAEPAFYRRLLHLAGIAKNDFREHHTFPPFGRVPW